MAESLHCSETITKLLIGYTRIQHKKLKRKKKNLEADYYRPKGLAQGSRTMKIIRDFDLFFFYLAFKFFKKYFIFWLHREACGILVPQPGIEPTSSALQAAS